MGKKKRIFGDKELNREIFLEVVLGNKVETAIHYISFDIAKKYINRYTNRNCLILNDKKRFDIFDLQNIAYTHVMNLKSQSIAIIDKRKKRNDTVFNIMKNTLKNSLLLVYQELDTISSDIMLNGNEGKGIDFMIHRDSFYDLTELEIKRANFFRFHKQCGIGFEKDNLLKVIKKVGNKDLGMGLYLANYLVSEQIRLREEYLKEMKEKFGDKYEVKINKPQIKREFSFFLYYNVKLNKIIGIKDVEGAREHITKLMFDKLKFNDTKMVDELIDLYF